MYIIDSLDKKIGNFSLKITGCHLEKGQIYAVVGPNGCGKTTFLNLLSFIDKPSKGEFYFQGQKVDYGNPDRLLQKRRIIGRLMQNPYLFDMSVRENVGYGLELRRVAKEEIRRRVGHILSLLSLTRVAGRSPRSLSGGEAQRTALARTLVLDTEVFLLDEPTANVDKNNIQIVEDLIRFLNREKPATVVFATHSNNQAYRMSKNIIPIINGRIADIVYENVFSGILKQEPDGLKSVAIGNSIRLKLTHGQSGPLTIAIDPHDIILSNQPFSSSALNRIQGMIIKIEEINSSLRVFIDAGDAGVQFCALVTRHSYYGLGLNIGKEVWVTFKANSIKVL